jgi:hypothetical protein
VTLLACICLTVLIVKGSIFARLRAKWPALLTCPLCLGWWIGLFGCVLAHATALAWRWALPSLECGVMSAVGSLAVYLALGLIEALWVLIDNENATKHGP